MKPRFILIIIALLAALLAACAGASTPKLIGSYPAGAGQNPPALYSSERLVYDGALELEVSNVSSAARQAENLAYDLGGYLSSSSSWKQQGRIHTTLVLCVPADHFEALYNRLLRLGSLISDNVYGQWVSGYGPEYYSQLTLTLRPRAFSLPELPSFGWNPLRTFERALGVFVDIFGFIVDLLIWVLVVAGPFVLIGLGIRALVRRLRKA